MSQIWLEDYSSQASVLSYLVLWFVVLRYVINPLLEFYGVPEFLTPQAKALGQWFGGWIRSCWRGWGVGRLGGAVVPGRDDDLQPGREDVWTQVVLGPKCCSGRILEQLMWSIQVVSASVGRWPCDLTSSCWKTVGQYEWKPKTWKFHFWEVFLRKSVKMRVKT